GLGGGDQRVVHGKLPYAMRKKRTVMRQSVVVPASTRVTRALISGVKPMRIIAHRRIGKVLSWPVTSSVIRVSSNDSAKASTAAETSAVRRLGSSTQRKVCQRLAPRSDEASAKLRLNACRRVRMVR